jgi:hypothetical protein
MFTRSSPSILFPVYLLPSTDFHRRGRSTDSLDFADSTAPTVSADRAHAGDYLTKHTSHLQCAKCASDVCLTSQIISKGFTGRHGKAYLVAPSPVSHEASMGACLPNTKTDAPTSRHLVTGDHIVSDVRCAFCNSILGWKYDEAEEESQRYKIGKYILETKKICSSSDWESRELQMPPVSLQHTELGHDRDGPIEFDSQDEDECEDLFAGVWTPMLAAKRRHGKSFRKVVSGCAVDTNARQS